MSKGTSRLNARRWNLGFRESYLICSQTRISHRNQREADRAKLEEKKRKNREAVKKHREKQRSRNVGATDSRNLSPMRGDGSSSSTDVDAADITNRASPPTFTGTPASTGGWRNSSLKRGLNHPTKHDPLPLSLMTLANAAFLEHVQNTAVESSSQSHAHKSQHVTSALSSSAFSGKTTCSVSTQTDTPSSDVTTTTRSIAIQTV